MWTRCLALLLAGGLAAVPGSSQAVPDEDGYEPEQGVARISLIAGEVSVRRGDSGELVAAELNSPLVVQDHVLTADGSRAEIQFDWANMIRLAPGTDVRMGILEDRDYMVQVAVGTTTFRVFQDANALTEISTPTVSVRPSAEGVYRVTVRPDGSTQVTVRSGEAEIFTPRGSEVLRSGRTLEARGDASDPEYMINSAIPRDEWDQWNEQRDDDLRLRSQQSYRYVSRDIYGASDLYGYGRWVYDTPYGWVWVPTVSASWAPYRYGRWTWVNYYGWSWLSADPWGWAPYHYGRWYRSRWGWSWYPGAIGPRYYWRPALVSFFGWGSGGFGLSLGFGFGNIGWVPLAPYEVYRPWYGRGFNNFYNNRGLRNNITIVNNTNITNIYRNAGFVNGRNGVTSVTVNNFGGRRRITDGNFVRASAQDLRQTGEIRGRVPIASTTEGRQFGNRTVNRQTLPQVAENTRFVANPARAGRSGAAGRGAGAAVARQGATAAQAAPQNNATASRGRPTSNGTAGTAGTAASAARPGRNQAATARTPDTGSRGSGVVQRNGTTAPANGAASNAAAANGWRRFDSNGQDSVSNQATLRSRGQGSGGVTVTPQTANRGTSSRSGSGIVEVAPQAGRPGSTGGSSAAGSTPAANSGGWRRFGGSDASGVEVITPRSNARSERSTVQPRTQAPQSTQTSPAVRSRGSSSSSSSGGFSAAPRSGTARPATPQTTQPAVRSRGSASSSGSGFSAAPRTNTARPAAPSTPQVIVPSTRSRGSSSSSSSGFSAAPRTNTRPATPSAPQGNRGTVRSRGSVSSSGSGFSAAPRTGSRPSGNVTGRSSGLGSGAPAIRSTPAPSVRSTAPRSSGRSVAPRSSAPRSVAPRSTSRPSAASRPSASRPSVSARPSIGVSRSAPRAASRPSGSVSRPSVQSRSGGSSGARSASRSGGAVRSGGGVRGRR